MGRWSGIGLPLLAKELAEQGARKRTYVIRTAYATLLCGLALLMFWISAYRWSTGPYDLLGQGRELLNVLFVLQTFGVVLFVPALTSGSITAEKERNTLGLLLLTRLSPGTILMEKYLSRVFAMLSFLLLTLPLLGFCYSLGGVEPKDIWMCSLALVTVVFQLSALGTLCSTYFRTSVAAFLATYLIGTAMYLLPGMAALALDESGLLDAFGSRYEAIVDSVARNVGQVARSAVTHLARLTGLIDTALRPTAFWQGYTVSEPELYLPLFPVESVSEVTFSDWRTEPVWHTLVKLIPAWCSTVLFLLLSRVFIVRRAFAPPRHYVMRVFRRLDALFQRLNERYTRGVVLVGDVSSLPVDQPVAWREVTKKSLGTFRYLLRIFLLIEFPIVFAGLMAITLSVDPSGRRHPLLTAMALLTWGLAMLFIIVKGSTLIAGERSSETLQVLLSTPISSRDIVRQKLAGVRRLMLAVAVPLYTVALLQTWYITVRSAGRGGDATEAFTYLTVQFLCMFIYLPMLTWLSLLIGVVMKTQSRAIFATLAIFVAWCALPLVVGSALDEVMNWHNESLVYILSPVTVPFLNEVGELEDLNHSIWFAVTANSLLYFGVWQTLRAVTLSAAPRLLGRAELPAGFRRREKTAYVSRRKPAVNTSESQG